MKDFAEGRVSVEGGEIWYTIAGISHFGKKGALAPLIVIHGGPGATHDYLEPLEELACKRSVIFYDQLGSGFSDKPDSKDLWTIERFTAELSTLRTRLSVKECHLLGQSWGAMLAVEYLLRYSSRGVHSLTLSGPFLDAKRWIDDQRKWIASLPKEIETTINKYEAVGDFSNEEYQNAINIFYSKHLCNLNPWPQCLMRTMEKMSGDVYGYMIGPSEFTLNGTLKDYDLSHRLEEIEIPVLLTGGEFDEARPESVKYFADKFRNSSYKIFEGGSHSHHLEYSKEYLSLIGDFLTNND